MGTKALLSTLPNVAGNHRGVPVRPVWKVWHPLREEAYRPGKMLLCTYADVHTCKCHALALVVLHYLCKCFSAFISQISSSIANSFCKVAHRFTEPLWGCRFCILQGFADRHSSLLKVVMHSLYAGLVQGWKRLETVRMNLGGRLDNSMQGNPVVTASLRLALSCNTGCAHYL